MQPGRTLEEDEAQKDNAHADFPIRDNLFYRLLFTLVLAVAIVGMPVFLLTYKYTVSGSQARLQSGVRQEIAILAASFEQEYLIAPRRALKQITNSGQLYDLMGGSREERLVNAKALEASFSNIAREHQGFSGMFYVDSQGAELAAVVNDERKGDFDAPRLWLSAMSQEPHFPTLAAGRKLLARLSTTPSLLSAGNMEWFMPPREILFEGPFRDEEGRPSLLVGLVALDQDSGSVNGAVIIRLDLSGFIATLKLVKVFDASVVWLLGRDGTPLLAPIGRDESFFPSKDSKSGPDGNTTLEVSDQGLVAFKDLGPTSREPLMRIAYAIPSALIARDFSSTRNLLLAVMVGGIIVTLLLAYFVSRSIARPITALAQAASRLAEGHLDARVRVRTGGEIGVLVRSFNTMAGSLQTANENRAKAMDALRQTANLLAVEKEASKDDVMAPESPALRSDELELRRVSTLILDLIRERDERVLQLDAAKQEADSANRAKSSFLATMSHEIRTPLNAIIGLTEILRSSMLSDENESILRTMTSAGTQLLAIINDVLDFSSLQSKRIELLDDAIEVRAFLDQILQIMRGLPDAAKVAVELDVDPDLPSHILGDAKRLAQILTNLLGNAVKFTDEGTVRLTAAATKDGASIEFRVSDTGPGIPAELGDTIFEPFKRDYSSTNKPGTGLGLSISRQLAIAMNGTLGIDPTAARGACFVLHVPLRSATSTPICDESSTAPSDLPLSILVAEDTPANQFVLRLMLNRLGHSVHTVNDGQAAVEAFAALKFDLVLLDVQMPVMDGYTAARTIRASGETGRAVPIIALTAFTQDSDRDAAFAAGVDAFITKPIRSQELISTIQRVCSPPSPATADRKPPRTD